jgi:hypothetical protein
MMVVAVETLEPSANDNSGFLGKRSYVKLTPHMRDVMTDDSDAPLLLVSE